MDDPARIRMSKFLSLVLRHRPQRVGLSLQPGGWIAVDELLTALERADRPVTRSDLEIVVATCDKQRFAFSPCGERIRASQGHSVDVELGYEATTPPATLFHGTTESRLANIRREGLRRMKRHHVHLSESTETAQRVGGRRGQAIVLTVHAGEMHDAGHEFFVSENRVWLTERVPPEYLEIPG